MLAPYSSSSFSSAMYNALDAQLPAYALHPSQLMQGQYSSQSAHTYCHAAMQPTPSPTLDWSMQCAAAVEELLLPPPSLEPRPPFPPPPQSSFLSSFDGSHAPFAYQQPPVTAALRALQLSSSAALGLAQADGAADCCYDPAAPASALLFDLSGVAPTAAVCSFDSLEPAVMRPQRGLPIASSASSVSFSSSSSSRSSTPHSSSPLPFFSPAQHTDSPSHRAAASTSAPSSPPVSRRPAPSQGDRRLKHRQIDAVRRRRELAVLDRFAALSGQREERVHRDRVSTLEVACDRYDALVRNTAALRRRMQRMERMLGGARTVGWEEGEVEDAAGCSAQADPVVRGVRARRSDGEEEVRASRRRRLEDCEALLRELQAAFTRSSCRAFTSSSLFAASTFVLCSVCLRTVRNREANLALFSHSGWQPQDVLGKVCGPLWSILHRHRLLGSLQCEESLRDRPPVRSRRTAGGEEVVVPLRAAVQREEVEQAVLAILTGEKDRADVRWRTGLSDGRSVELITALWLIWTGGTDAKGKNRGGGGGGGRRWLGGLEDADLLLVMQPASMAEYVEEMPALCM